MKIKVLCMICNKEFETEEMEWDETIESYYPKKDFICFDCQEDNNLI